MHDSREGQEDTRVECKVGKELTLLTSLRPSFLYTCIILSS